MKFDRKKLTDDQLLSFYQSLLLPRLIEEKMIILLRQGKVSKWFSGIGQEATSVGAALAMDQDEFILPMHRNLGMFTVRDIPLDRLFAQFQGKEQGFTKGRDRSFHFGSIPHHLVGMISHLGPQLGLADGIALGHQLKGERKATLVVTGDGGASEGDFHEALNVASVWQLPVIFLVENNQWGLSTPSCEQFNFESFTLKGPGYGIKTKQVNGNNLLEVYHAIKDVAEQIRNNPEPFLFECMTFRMRGHEESSGTKYYPEGLADQWQTKDPVLNYEQFLINEGILHPENISDIRHELSEQINEALAKADAYPKIKSNPEQELADIYFPHQSLSLLPKTRKKSNLRFMDAISESMRYNLRQYPNLVIMGQDIAEYGGVFKLTEGLSSEFGKDRVRNTPLCESAIIGASLGLSILGMKSIVEMQFSDFVTNGFNQIVNNLAKIHYRWGQNADVVIRLPTGAGVSAGPFHSQSTESWFFRVPGLKIVYPSTPYDAKGLLNAAISDPNPFLFFEHKAMYRSISQPIPDEPYTVEVGKARVVTKGNDLTIITYGMGVIWAQQAVQKLSKSSIEIIDLRTLLPWDQVAVAKSIQKTSKVLVLHEDTLTGGIGAEIAAWISEHLFKYLDAPVMRLGSMDSPVPFAAELEETFLPKNKLLSTLKELLAY